ncbi:hypothetical protein EGW08_018917 [Elysia chlorotica]|uniref:Uncharacterized protein n=1 Tax=Elysia chlorotica TaxID=188477 RepID=A0A3S0ZR36_ELYCH|nr:hypothetical protein EGW08_018917 [Elysia chlorotica]
MYRSSVDALESCPPLGACQGTPELDDRHQCACLNTKQRPRHPRLETRDLCSARPGAVPALPTLLLWLCLLSREGAVNVFHIADVVVVVVVVVGGGGGCSWDGGAGGGRMVVVVVLVVKVLVVVVVVGMVVWCGGDGGDDGSIVDGNLEHGGAGTSDHDSESPTALKHNFISREEYGTNTSAKDMMASAVDMLNLGSLQSEEPAHLPRTD